ncbi:MAG: hypothetical protein KJZ74_07525 [Gemmatimonadales bacterium]|nr:hypothetical protein [Gemmatimonadales bacterium]
MSPASEVDMSNTPPRTPETMPSAAAPRAPYRAPALRALGNAADLTRVVSMIGNMDGGMGNGGMSRTG